jgi:hypothetical protein
MSKREPGHYTAKRYDPDPGSYLAYLIASGEILSRDPGVELWMTPFSVTQQMVARDADWVRRVNPLLEYLDREYRAAAMHELRQAGVVDVVLPQPNARVERLIEILIAGYRAREIARAYARAPVPPHEEHFNRPSRLAAGVFFETPGRTRNERYRLAATMLNREAQERGKQLTRDHVFRAHRRYMADLHRHVNTIVLRSRAVDVETYLTAEIISLRATISGLAEVYRQARDRGIFSSLKGRSLAIAIDDKFDLSVRLGRALDAMDDRRRRCAA